MWVLTPSYRPVGGVVKIMDYVNHALEMGFEVVLACPRGSDPESPLWRMDAFRHLPNDSRVRFLEDLRIAPAGDDLVFFSWPSHIADVVPRLPDGFSLHQVVHIVQNTRHANPTFADGWGVRALARPLTRIVINDQVLEAIEPLLSRVGITEVVPLGHRADHFAVERSGGLPHPVTVGYTTWKSEVGDRVAELLSHDERFQFRAVREAVDWDDLRELYARSDVFLCTPSVQEGFYLPGLEAMAARCVVLTPDAGGNLAYAFFGENCVEVAFEDEDDYAARLREVLEWPDARIAELRAAGRLRVEAHSLASEAAAFGALVERIDEAAGLEVVAPVPRVRARRADPAFALLTGIPRSGTTLATHLLNQLDDVVAMGEPLRPATLMPADGGSALLDALEVFFEEQRTSAVERGRVVAKVVDGTDVDNYVATPDEADGLRQDVAARGTWVLDRPVTPDVRMVVKDLSLSTAVLGALVTRFHVVALVRNPVAILASWETVDMPFREGHAPHAEWFNEDLARRLDVDDRRERQLRLLEWWFEQFQRHLPADRVLRYEDIVATGGRALEVVVPEAAQLEAELTARNENPAYATVDRDELVDLVLSRPDAPWWRHYTQDDVEALRSRVDDRAV